MNIIAKLTLRTMSKNKKRTIVTIIGVIISVAMIMAVSTIAYSFTNYMGENAMKKTGQFHVVFEKLPYENKDEVLKGDNIGDSFLGKVIGDYDVRDIIVNGERLDLVNVADAKELDNNDSYDEDFKTVCRLIGLDKEGFGKIYFGNNEYMLGSYPENENEIMVSSWYSTLLNVENVGDIITLDGKDYKVSGIYADMDFETKKITIDNQTTFAMYTYRNINSCSNGDYINIYSKLKDLGIGDIYENLKNIKNASGAENYYDNSDVLYYYGVADNELGNTMNIIKYTLIAVIMIGAISLIANGFSISLSERSRYLGMIASVGATKKQKRYSVFFEGFIVGIISIPIGILSGYAGTIIVFKIIEGKMYSIFGDGTEPIKAVVQPWIIISVIVFSVVTIFVSAYIPARRASKITPIDAIRQSKDIKINARQIKTRKITRKMFGFEGELALKNLKRNKKKYSITVFSMVISIVLFLTVYAFVFYLKQSSEMVYSTNTADMEGNIFNADDDTYEKIISDMTTDKVFGSVAFRTEFDDSSVFKMNREDAINLTTNDFKKYFDDYYGKDVESDDVHINIVKYNNIYLEKFLGEIGMSCDEFLSGDSNVIVVNSETVKAYDKNGSPKFYDYSVLKAEKNDKFTLEITSSIFDNESKNENKPENSTKEVELKIFLLADSQPLGMNMKGDVNIIVTENMFNNILNLYPEIKNDDMEQDSSEYNKEAKYENAYISTFFAISGGKQENHTSEVDKITEKYNADYYGYSWYEQNKENKDMMFIVEIFIYGFISLMTIVCAANIFNTTSTDITLRRREFATLRSVGMTKKAFNRMIMYESCFYGMKALLYGLPASILIILFIWYNFTDAFLGMKVIPWTGIIIAVAAVFIVAGSSMLYASAKIKKANIIDGLKDENI